MPALFIELIGSAQHLEFCTTVKCVAHLLLFLGIKRIYELLGKEIALFEESMLLAQFLGNDLRRLLSITRSRKTFLLNTCSCKILHYRLGTGL